MNKNHASVLSNMPCICCELLGQRQQGRTCIHHIREGQGIAMRAGDYLTIPLCYECHQGKLGIHGDKTYLRILKMSELDLLNETLKRVYKAVA
ncbi:Ref family recombination enhancement nuclease [uncultured Gilliamella sp.]|uniref:Ref family recombination enhancement nuclease n=1 Tax=uncultured Gilliamella sp. TaxID=1193505 RepID=UPI00344BBD0E